MFWSVSAQLYGEIQSRPFASEGHRRRCYHAEYAARRWAHCAGIQPAERQARESGFSEIQKPPKRYAIIDLKILSELNGFPDPKVSRSTKAKLSAKLKAYWAAKKAGKK